MRILQAALEKLHQVSQGQIQVSDLPSQLRWELIEEGLIKDDEVTEKGFLVVKLTPQKQPFRDSNPEFYKNWKEGKFKELTNDDETIFSVVDSEGQLLEFRVGPVFFEDKTEPNALWISYQEHHQQSDMVGPVLLSLDTFKKLVEYVNKFVPVGQLDDHRKNGTGSLTGD